MAAAASPGRPRVVVVGAGLAGLAAALDLTRGGLDVTLVERRPEAGGRACSFEDRRGGLPPLDNGQHVLLGCCTRLRGLLRDLGAADCVRLQPLLRVPVWHDGRRSVLGSWPLPGALHLLPSLLGYRHLPAADRVRAVAAGVALLGAGAGGGRAVRAAANGEAAGAAAANGEAAGAAAANRGAADAEAANREAAHAEIVNAEAAGASAGHTELPEAAGASAGHTELPEAAGASGETLEAWLARHGQGREAVERLWDLVVVAVLNCRADDAGAAEALAALRTGFLSGWGAARLGFFRVPLGEVGRRAASALAARGTRMLLGASAVALQVDAGAVRGVRLADGRVLPADACVSAVPPAALARLLPPAWAAHPVLRAAADLPWSPILNLYALYDRPVLREDLAAFVGGRLQFAFNRGRLLGQQGLDGRLVGMSLSAADELADWTPEQVTRVLDGELRSALPGARGAHLLTAVPLWQRRATFRAGPGSAGRRPGPRSPLPGLYLAGDWTDTGWPASLEGAVRSGQTAAALVQCGPAGATPQPGWTTRPSTATG